MICRQDVSAQAREVGSAGQDHDFKGSSSKRSKLSETRIHRHLVTGENFDDSDLLTERGIKEPKATRVQFRSYSSEISFRSYCKRDLVQKQWILRNTSNQK